MPIDYSKWDHLDDSDEAASDGSAPVDAADVVMEPRKGHAPRKPRVTHFKAATRVHLGPEMRAPAVGAVEHWYAWEQSRTQVWCWIRLPGGEALQRKGYRTVLLIEERPADYQPNVPTAITAADGDADADGNLFPVAWGVKITWPVEPDAAEGGDFWRIDRDVGHFEAHFPLPVCSSADLWNWEVKSDCPLVSEKTRWLSLELTKKTSKNLGNVCIYWDKMFVGGKSIDVGAQRPNAARGAEFSERWKEAHALFASKMKARGDTRVCVDAIEEDGTKELSTN